MVDRQYLGTLKTDYVQAEFVFAGGKAESAPIEVRKDLCVTRNDLRDRCCDLSAVF